MDDFHLRLARLGFDAGDDLGLVLAGGYAIAAHQLTARPSRDVDFATASSLPLPQITNRLADAYRAVGLVVTIVESTPRMARMEVSDGIRLCEVDLLKEAIGPPTRLSVGPVLAVDDAVGLKMRALHDRALHRDFIDVRAASAAGYTIHDLERLARQHTPHFTLEELADRLSVAVDRDDRGFAAYGLDAAAIAEVRAWAAQWEAEIRARPLTGIGSEALLEDPDWAAYLDGT